MMLVPNSRSSAKSARFFNFDLPVVNYKLNTIGPSSMLAQKTLLCIITCRYCDQKFWVCLHLLKRLNLFSSVDTQCDTEITHRCSDSPAGRLPSGLRLIT